MLEGPDAVVLDFEVAAAGSYRITLTDFGTVAGPLRMARVGTAVLRGARLLRAAGVNSAAAGVATAAFNSAGRTASC
jgi:hypothetical protein